jgi:DNA (cytosine-5)-methyltransferase 1
MSRQVMPKYSIVDLFSGAGGLSYGFLQTGRFIIKAAFEINPCAQKTYLRNHGDHVSMYSDVEDALSEKIKAKLGKVDVIIGGPPCQGFSNANRQKNHAISHNNYLVKKFVQAILHLKPMAFIMENVSMLQSNVHRFYVDKSDRAVIKQYGITSTPAEIQLLDKAFLFDGVTGIVKDKAKIADYLWNEKDYLIMNVIYKARKNKKKLKKALAKHQKCLLALAESLIARRNKNDHIIHHNNIAGDVLQKYFANNHTDKKATVLCNAIEPAIMLQQMLSKAMEIHDNHIIVTGYTKERGLAVQVSSISVIDYIDSILGAKNNEYNIIKGVLSAAAFGVPQKRMRFVVMGIRKTIADNIALPTGTFDEKNFQTVKDAIKDIESIKTTINVEEKNGGVKLPKIPETISKLGRQLRDSNVLYNHVSTNTTQVARKRFVAIRQGENFHSLPSKLKTTYSDTKRTQNTIYLRLRYNEPSGTVVNVRKSMWIHPVHHRALSIREAARLQTFPDSFVFCGTKDSQYQQIGNAVPPILARALAEHLCGYMDKGKEKLRATGEN